MKVGIIGGSGIYDPNLIENPKEKKVETPYGAVHLFIGRWQGEEIAFLPRHGIGHQVPPHFINYRGNISALKSLGVERILSTSAVGSLNSLMKPGDFVLLSQFIDFTKGRPTTFEGDRVVHVDMSEPYCPVLRAVLLEAAENKGYRLHPEGVYICTEGPRFETPAEIKAFRLLGADVVGMTNIPEVILAREAEICYASLAIVTNMAAGISSGRITAQEVNQIMNEVINKVKELFSFAIPQIPKTRTCFCKDALKGASP